MEFQRLFQPMKLRSLTLRNRVVMTAIHLTYSENGSVNDRIKHFYWRRAEGGAAMLVIGGIASDNYVGYPNMLRLDKEEFVPGYQELTDGIHQRGVYACAQLLQTGRYGKAMFVEGDDSIISASAVPSKMSGDMPRAMTKDEIKTVCARAGEAANRAKRAGFDCVELTAASGYMISQFLSPVTNLRKDEYGGSFENRCRFGLEMVAAVRQAIGPDFPLCVRVAGNEFMPGGNTNTECVELCKLLEQAGVDLIDVTGGWHETTVPQLPGDVPRGGYVYLAEAIKNSVSIPVLSANRHNDPVEAERVLALGQADVIGMCRTLIADPDWPVKTQSGRIDELRKCVACNQGCLANCFSYKPCKCLVNSDAGREYLGREYQKTDMSKNILVIGAGPAGCEFAIRSAQRGHQVTLWEKEIDIGGQLDLVSEPPAKKEFGNLKPYFKTMLDKSGVQVVLGKKATAEEVYRAGFDIVIFAAGSTPKTISLPGNRTAPVYTAEDILTQKVIAGKRVVIVGGSSVGCETADYLAREAAISEEKLHFLMNQSAERPETIQKLVHSSSREIAIVDIAKIGTGFDFGCGWPVLKDLQQYGVRQYPKAKILDVSDTTVTIEVTDRKTGAVNQKLLPCDTLILTVGYQPNNRLAEELSALNIQVVSIGNADQPGNILKAIHRADDLAASL